jgi:hypothetical protein
VTSPAGHHRSRDRIQAHARNRQPLSGLGTNGAAFVRGQGGTEGDLSTCSALRVIRRRLRRLQCMECEKRILDWPGLVAWLLSMAAGYPRRWRRYGIAGPIR